LEEADGAKKTSSNFYSAGSDPFPGIKNKIQFNDSSSPASSTLWNGAALNKPVFNISENGGIITFTFINEPHSSAPVTTAANGQLKIHCSGNTLYIESQAAINTIEVFNTIGQSVKKQNGTVGVNAMELMPNQVYIVLIDGKAFKVLM
jgi:hypothetical protein